MTRGNLWQTFANIARDHPDREAFASPEAVVYYGQMASAAGELADRLSARNVGTGDLVAVEMPVGPGFVVSVLAALAVGAAYLPIDVSSPTMRRRRILEDARPSVVLRAEDDALSAALRSGTVTPGLLGLDRHEPVTGDDDPAYVIYTSGSTGVPKGAVIPARGVHNLLRAFQRCAPLEPGSRYSWWTSPGFDVSVYEVWSALCDGGTLLPVPDSHRRDIDATLDYLAEQRVNSAYLPPQFLPALRDRVLEGGRVPPLRRLLTGVEPVPVGVLAQLRSRMPGIVVINGYGPTEATVCATLYPVPGQCADPAQRTPIGAVIEGNRGFLLDDQLTPVEPGKPGELFLAGRGLALGYLHDRQRTAERFLPAVDGDGLMYRTGDVVVADHAGILTFLGRVDDQLKIDGVRIEPAETEAVLRRLPRIADVAVLAWPTGPGGPSVLTAFVVLSETVDVGSDLWTEIKERLAEELPPQAVPRRFFALDRIPMTSDGKLDRLALPEPPDRPARSPRDARERAVEKSCRAVLPHAPASVLDHGFAELGGDSLQAALLAAALRTDIGRAVTASHVLAAPTLADLAAKIAALPAAALADGELGLDAAPLTPGQAGIWVAELANSSPGAFHESVAVEMTGVIDPHRVARELASVLNRHAVFRGHIDEQTMRFVTSDDPLSVDVRVLGCGKTVDGAWQELLTALQRRAFDLGRGPLVRAAVLAAPETVRVLIVWHHLVVDAWSARIVLEELATALSSHGVGSPLEYGHADYAYRQRRYLESTEGKLAVRAAADRVRGWLPRGQADANPAQDSCQLTELAVGPRVWSNVRDCARRNGTTVFAVTLAAFLGPLCGLAETRGRFALAVADRDEVTDADAAGYFLTIVPFGPGPSHDRDVTPQAALRHAHHVLSEARAMSRVPFPSLMAELGLRDTRPIAPLVIAWSRDVVPALPTPGYTVRSLPVRPMGVRWPWTVLLTDRADHGMSGLIEFPPWIADGRVASFASHAEPLLDAFASAM